MFKTEVGGTHVNNERVWKNTDKENSSDINIDEIQKAYNRIDKNWLMLHYKISIGLVIFAFIVECGMGVIWVNTDMMSTTVQRFILKFTVVPSIINSICIAINTFVIKSKFFSQNQKIYTVSLVLVTICFVLFTVHSAFTATYFIFSLAIIMTVIYANYRITNITAITSIAALVISELFIKWDLDKISIFESTLRLGNFLISIFMLVAFSVVCSVVIRYERGKNEASIQMETERHQLQQRLRVDEMTGLFNRKALENALKDMDDNDGEDNYILAIADIDNFKGINDNWGHHIGDRCLIEFARIFKENCGKAVPFRFGGDEFCLLFRNADINEAVFTCENIKSQLNSLNFEENLMLRLTASFGLAAYTDQIDTQRLFIHSDHALYEAKKIRNTIHVYKKQSKAVD